MDELIVLLKDRLVLNYMLKNENVLLKHYTMPEGDTPRKFLLKASNRSNDQVKGETNGSLKTRLTCIRQICFMSQKC